MVEENLNISEQTVEFHLVTIFEKLENLRQNNSNALVPKSQLPIRVEIRTLEFWRSVISECLASFVYIFVVCGAAAGSGAGTTISSMLLATALASGFAMTSLTQCFGHISGAHVNPAVSIALGVTKHISVLRMTLFVIAQCGGGIAGAAFLYSVSVPGYRQNLQAALNHSASVSPWERFGIEVILTFIVVFSYFVSMETYRKWMNSSALTIGATYSACSFVAMPYLNPARSLGPSFVLNRWDNHWVFWLGPIFGGIASGLTYEYIFNLNRSKLRKESSDSDSISIRSDEDTYDDLDKPPAPKFHGSTYNTYRPAGAVNGLSGYCPSLTSASLYSAPATKLERVESLYGGTKSLYCKSPPLTRANLNRSQSVYTKSNTAVNRDIIPKPGPLVPAQSLYPMRLNQQNHAQNQNMQNQIQQRSDSIYGIRGVTPGTTRPENCNANERITPYNRNNQTESNSTKYEENQQPSRRPESMYGLSQRRTQNDDSNYSYHGTAPRNNAGTHTYNSSNSSNYSAKGGIPNRSVTGSEIRQASPSQLLSTASSSAAYHHNVPQHSPNPQYQM